jgi:hypothetical protein
MRCYAVFNMRQFTEDYADSAVVSSGLRATLHQPARKAIYVRYHSDKVHVAS